MCRITGILNFKSIPIDENDIISMRDTMISGGPDGCGIWTSENKRLALGHRRLSILDLSESGAQPMQTLCGRYIICYNGEIYNFNDLRREHFGDEIHFRSSCDTEVLLNLIALKGLDALGYLHGMFALAIWDNVEETLTLARDRIGVKPLYYAVQNSTFLFGSELKSIMANPSFQKNVSSEALELFLQYSYVPSPYCILTDVNKLGPGQWLKANINGDIEVGTWWNISSNYVNNFDWENSSYAEVENELERRLTNSFEMRMITDVPLGIFLSGGIDSSLLLALLSQKNERKIKTFTIGFSEEKYNEAHHAKSVAAAIGSDHHELYLNVNEGLRIIEKLPTIWDEPFGDNSAIATELLCDFTSKHVKVALSADGGDELFCGYPKYWLTCDRIRSMDKNSMLCKLISKLPNSLLECVGRKYIGNKLLKISDIFRNGGPTFRNAFIFGQQVFTDHQLNILLQNKIDKTSSPHFNLWDQLDNFDDLTKMMAVDLTSYHTDDILVKVDRASMANSIEAREPFLDQDIVEFAFGMPQKYKLPNNDYSKSKNILRNILYKYVDKKLIERPKMGFGVPLDIWLNYQLEDFVSLLLDTKKLENQGIFNPNYVKNLRNQFKINPERNLNKIWNIIVFQQWYDQWLS